jgi:hypothetical protein
MKLENEFKLLLKEVRAFSVLAEIHGVKFCASMLMADPSEGTQESTPAFYSCTSNHGNEDLLEDYINQTIGSVINWVGKDNICECPECAELREQMQKQ